MDDNLWELTNPTKCRYFPQAYFHVATCKVQVARTLLYTTRIISQLFHWFYFGKIIPDDLEHQECVDVPSLANLWREKSDTAVRVVNQNIYYTMLVQMYVRTGKRSRPFLYYITRESPPPIACIRVGL